MILLSGNIYTKFFTKDAFAVLPIVDCGRNEDILPAIIVASSNKEHVFLPATELPKIRPRMLCYLENVLRCLIT